MPVLMHPLSCYIIWGRNHELKGCCSIKYNSYFGNVSVITSHFEEQCISLIVTSESSWDWFIEVVWWKLPCYDWIGAKTLSDSSTGNMQHQYWSSSWWILKVYSLKLCCTLAWKRVFLPPWWLKSCTIALMAKGVYDKVRERMATDKVNFASVEEDEFSQLWNRWIWSLKEMERDKVNGTCWRNNDDEFV